MLTIRNGAADPRAPQPDRMATLGVSSGAPPEPPPPALPSGDEPGDVLYGAKAIARFLFGSDGRREQRRVFNLWSHYQHRKEQVGFFKLKGAVCLSKSLWRKFQGR